jgi:hypothetical protein
VPEKYSSYWPNTDRRGGAKAGATTAKANSSPWGIVAPERPATSLLSLLAFACREPGSRIPYPASLPVSFPTRFEWQVSITAGAANDRLCSKIPRLDRVVARFVHDRKTASRCSRCSYTFASL